MFNELILNIYKNMFDDSWYNRIIDSVSFSFPIIERIGYIYYYDGQGEGTPKFQTIEQKSRLIREYITFLYFDYNFCKVGQCKSSIIENLRSWNTFNQKIQINNFRSHFEVLNNLLEEQIKNHDLRENEREYCKILLKESKI